MGVTRRRVLEQMRLLAREDAWHLQAAQGWLELGNPVEANLELDQINELFRMHPDVLQLRWHAHARQEKWDVCVEVGRAMTRLTPEVVQGWINLANALFYLKHYQEAFDTLFPTLLDFPKNPYIPYNLACYQCQLGNLAEARDWLDKAIGMGGERIRETALLDSDLQGIWGKIA